MLTAQENAPAAGAAEAQGVGGRDAHQPQDAHGTERAPQGPGDPLKAWRTAQARATLAGFTANLTDGDDGRPQLVCSRWAMTRAFDNLAELETWLVRVEGKAG